MTFEEFAHSLHHQPLASSLLETRLLIRHEDQQLPVVITATPFRFPGFKGTVLPLEYASTMPDKVVAMLRSKLGLNTTVFARHCTVKKTERVVAEAFLDRYHLMGVTQSAFNYGLYDKEELVAVASFSKGRKMDRLPGHQRSFELIRFCCRSGITVTGGLTRLVKTFALDKQAGDVMTYVDKQLSDGKAFERAGFKKHGESEPVRFLVNRRTFERSLYKDGPFDADAFYVSGNLGNIKLVYTPGE